VERKDGMEGEGICPPSFEFWIR